MTGPGAVVGDEIARNPGTHGVGFIGSTETGRRVAEAAAGKAAVLELGGNGPVVVLDDADLDLAAEATVAACFLCSGQSCTAGERLLVHHDVREEFVARLARLVAERVLLGDPFAETTTMGPLNNEGVAAKWTSASPTRSGAEPRSCTAASARAASRPTCTGSRPSSTSIGADALVATDETFEPGTPVVAIDSVEHAIELANASPYGLLSAIFTRDLAKGLRYADEVRTDWVNVDGLVELLGDAPAVRRPRGRRERHRPRGKLGAARDLHRAADDRAGVTWDYVIVGGGSAGSALAARLTEDTLSRVLVLKAGDYDRIGIRSSTCPRRSRSRSATRATTGCTAPSRSRSCTAAASTTRAAGCSATSSSINGMIFQPGNPLDYDRWASAAGLETLLGLRALPAVLQTESRYLPSPGADDWRGGDGPIVCSSAGRRPPPSSRRSSRLRSRPDTS